MPPRPAAPQLSLGMIIISIFGLVLAMLMTVALGFLIYFLAISPPENSLAHTFQKNSFYITLVWINTIVTAVMVGALWFGSLGSLAHLPLARHAMNLAAQCILACVFIELLSSAVVAPKVFKHYSPSSAAERVAINNMRDTLLLKMGVRMFIGIVAASTLLIYYNLKTTKKKFTPAQATIGSTQNSGVSQATAPKTPGAGRFRFSLSWKNEQQTVICNCIGQDLGPANADIHTVKIVQVVECRVAKTNPPGSAAVPDSVRAQADLLAGKGLRVPADVIKHNLLHQIKPPAV